MTEATKQKLRDSWTPERRQANKDHFKNLGVYDRQRDKPLGTEGARPVFSKAHREAILQAQRRRRQREREAETQRLEATLNVR